MGASAVPPALAHRLPYPALKRWANLRRPLRGLSRWSRLLPPAVSRLG